MAVKVNLKDDALHVKIRSARLEGQNEVFRKLVEEGDEWPGIYRIIFDMQDVDYVNSLGIAEFISIHRYFNSESEGQVRMQFCNLRPKVAELFKLVELGEISDLNPQ